jgi:hypothetical protein
MDSEYFAFKFRFFNEIKDLHKLILFENKNNFIFYLFYVLKSSINKTNNN